MEPLKDWKEAVRFGFASLFPEQPYIPNPPPSVVGWYFSDEGLKAFRLLSAPMIVRINYDVVQIRIEEGIRKMHEQRYNDWLLWVGENL